MKKIILLGKCPLSVFLACGLIGCSSKPKPSVEKAPATRGDLAFTPLDRGSEGPGDEARRQMMLKRANEVFRAIYFPYDKADLDEQSKGILVGIRSYMLEYPEVSVSIEGHADERGTNDYNIALGENRANSVAGYLAQLGVPRGSLKPVSYGEEKPAQEGHSEAQWGLNRRAEFVPVF